MRRVLTVILALTSCALFAQTRADIEAQLQQLRQIGQREGWHFKMDYSPVLEIPLAQRTGLVRSPEWKKNATWTIPTPVRDLPSSWDWRDHNGVTPVQNQGNCGSCWAFGTVASFESAVLLATKNEVGLSEQQLVDCDSQFNGCGGGDFAFGFWTNTGAAHRSDYPYVASNQSCDSSVAQHEKVAQWSYVGSSNREPTTDELKQAIYQHGVVAVSVAANLSFSGYSSGIYDACNGWRVNHIVALVGWDDSTQTWIMKNSWGTSWGENGYMRIKYTGRDGSKCNDIGGSAAYATLQQ